MSHTSSSQASAQDVQLALQVYPSRAESARDLTGLETAMQSLALDAHSPLALEIAATATSRAFLLRATNPVALQHLAAQMQSRYPQAQITSLPVDPLHLASSEECSAVELLPGAASYLPMRAFRAQDLLHEGVDPLLGILAAFNHLPSNARAIVQLALVPASPAWSVRNRRLAAQHVLDTERLRSGREPSTRALDMGRIAMLFVLVLLLVVISRFHTILFPRWLLQAGTALLRGKTPTLSAGQTVLLIGGSIGLLLLLFGGAFIFTHFSARLAPPALYDQRLVAEKAARPAYRTRLRIFVITPGETRPLLAGEAPTVRRITLIWLSTVQASGFVLLDRLMRVLKSLKNNFWQCSLRQRIQHAFLALRTWSPAQIWLLVLRRGRTGKARVIVVWAAIRREWQSAWRTWREWRIVMQVWRKVERDRARSRQEVLAMLTASYGQYHTASGGYFSPRRLTRQRLARILAPGGSNTLWFKRGWSADLSRSPHYLSVADLAALWHLPQAQDLADLSYITWSTTRTLLAPSVLTTGQGYRLGSSTHAGQQVPVFFPYASLRQNLLAVASTGKGKSSLLLHLALALFTARTSGHLRGGLMQIDFHGDLHQLTLACLPIELEDEVVQIDLAERTRLVGLNPLDVSHGADRDKIVDNLITLIEAIWPNSYGPRTENILEYACKSLVEANLTLVARDPIHGPDEQYTLLDVVPLVRDDSFRHAILEQVHDPYIHSWWDQYFERHDARQRSEYTSSVVTKFSKFASSHVARRILGQPRSTIRFGEIIAQEKLLLISCASGEVGADIAAFVGAMLLGLFHIALAEQARLHASARRQVLVLIDEFQALTGVNYQTMLAELRKYGGSFALATQSLTYLDRLDRSLRATVLANIDHLFAFAMSSDDAQLLRLDGVEPEDIVNLPNYTCYARLLLEGQRLPVFSLHLDDPVPGHTQKEEEERSKRISLRSHLRYARPVGEIDALLLAIQAREALMMQPVNGKRKPSGEERPGSQNTDTPRGTRKRGGSGKSTGRTKEKEEPPQQETQLIHDLFADPVPVEEGEQESEEQEDHHA